MDHAETEGMDERAAILAAAWDVLHRSGFEALKMQLVARRAGVSARSLYRHFADKDALVIALIEDEASRAAAHLAAAVARVDLDDPVGQVEAWLRGVIGAATDPARFHRARLFSSQQSVMRQFPAEVDAITDLLVSPLEEALQRGIEARLFPWADASRDARLVYALAGAGLTTALGHADDPSSVELLITEVLGFVLRALGVAPSNS